jgi:putative transposase
MKALAVGGIADHCHILLSLPSTMAIAKAIQLVKTGSSKWVLEQTCSRRFDWQEGYGAFTIGASQVPATIHYIENQARHHKKVSSAEEWEMFLRRYAPFLYGD